MTGQIAICLGGARSVWAEFEAAKEIIGDAPYIVGACNYAGIEYSGHLDFWGSLHPELMDAWRADRAERGFNTDYRAFIYRVKQNSAGEVVPYRWYGSSGIYMAQIALEQMGASGAILCGVPMDDTGGHIRHGAVWDHAGHYRQAFIEAHAAGVNIRSMGGWTSELFGSPDHEWLSCA